MSENVVRFIGDTHCSLYTIDRMLAGCDKTIHVGDVGIGFYPRLDEDIKKLYAKYEGSHRFIRGNHDNVDVMRRDFEGYFIDDGFYDKEDDMFFVGGAFSINKNSLVENVDWWPSEQVTKEQYDVILENYKKIKPSVVVSHDLPFKIGKSIFGMFIFDIKENITSRLLQEMYEFHQPKLWICGHWHDSRSYYENGTNFIVVDKSSCVEIDLKEYV